MSEKRQKTVPIAIGISRKVLQNIGLKKFRIRLNYFLVA